MEPKTGKIITMCNVPDFDPNTYNEVEDMAVYNNSAIYEAYEPPQVLLFSKPKKEMIVIG